jgi:hypothetical protein
VTRPGWTRASRIRWLICTAGCLAFPLAGLAGTAVVGRVDSPVAAVVGGVVAGLDKCWPAEGDSTSADACPGLGLLLGAVVDGSSLPDLALMGALTGLVLGPAQALAPPRGARMRWAWAAALRVLG